VKISAETPFIWKPVPLPGPVTLRGRHVTLEPLNAARHAGDLWQAVADYDEIWTWLFDGPFLNEDDLRQAIEAKQADSSTVFLAIVPEVTGQAGSPRTGLSPGGDQAVGWASLMRAEPAHGVIEVGNILFAPQLQRTTAATEAMFLMATHVFDHLGYRRYEWKCNALNLPSRRAAERLGFTFEGIFRQHMVIKGQSRDTAWYSMLDCEWPARRQAFASWLAQGNFDSDGRQQQSLSAIAAAQK
jgi:RimJ/RimL family protein N-acetyltransferase